MCAISMSALDCTAHILGSKLPLYYRDKAYLSLDKIAQT